MSKLDIKKDKWFFDAQNEQQSRAFQSWLFAQGFRWVSPNGATAYKDVYADCVGANSGVASQPGSQTLGFADRNWYVKNGHTEIFPTFKTVIVVDFVDLPEVELPQHKQIRELEETIAKAQEQIQSLKRSNQ